MHYTTWNGVMDVVKNTKSGWVYVIFLKFVKNKEVLVKHKSSFSAELRPDFKRLTTPRPTMFLGFMYSERAPVSSTSLLNFWRQMWRALLRSCAVYTAPLARLRVAHVRSFPPHSALSPFSFPYLPISLLWLVLENLTSVRAVVEYASPPKFGEAYSF
jgi:hypothetical protein